MTFNVQPQNDFKKAFNGKLKTTLKFFRHVPNFVVKDRYLLLILAISILLLDISLERRDSKKEY